MLTRLGQFELLEVIGRGGMGTVYRGIDPLIGRAVAVKVIRLLGYKDGEEQLWLKSRLFREARAAGTLNHPGIVTIYQVGEEQDVAYIAMEFVDGPNLEELLGREDRHPVALCRMLVEAAKALDYAHARGLVHRDVKPANLMITAAGRTKVTDFGIAKTMIGQTETKTGMLLGTPFYMSPEQISGKPLDGRSDQFALAVIAYEIFTGRKPFNADQVTSVCYQILHEEPLSPESVNPSIEYGVAAVIRRGLSKQPDKRYSSCTAFAEELLSAAEQSKSLPQPAAPIIDGAQLGKSPATASLISKRTKRTLVALTGIAAVLFIGIVAGIVVLLGLKSEKQTLGAVTASIESPSAIRPSAIRPSAIRPSATKDESTKPSAFEAAAIHDRTPTPVELPRPPKLVSSPLFSPKSTVHPLPLPTPAEERKEALPNRPAQGLMVWTGRLRPGDLLSINNSHPSTGTLAGAMPDGPASFHIYPAQQMSTGLTAYTSDAREPGTRVLGGPASVTVTFDPRHATDLVTFERPGADNGWNRLSLRANTSLSACVIEWRAQ